MHFRDKITDGVTVPVLARPIRSKNEERMEHTDLLYKDLEMSKYKIERNIGNKVVSIAYPYGYYNEVTEETIKSLGLNLSYLVKPGVNRKENGPYLLKRINVGPEMSGQDIIERIEQYSSKHLRTY
jgi:peptidoglycan/xylan/chitin deacetylase (PgdA/CDA1 family)